MFFVVAVGVMTSSTMVPRFTLEPQSSVVRTGSSVALTCAVEPQIANIRWTLNGSTISPQGARRRGIELTRDGQLVIAAFNRLSSSSSSSSSVSVAAGRVSHEGVYQCAAVTHAGVIVSSEARLQNACTTQFLCVCRVVIQPRVCMRSFTTAIQVCASCLLVLVENY